MPFLSDPSIRHGVAPLDGARIHYVTAGPEDGPPVVLLHGWPQHLLSWQHVVPTLATAGHRVVAIDLRGSGGSSIPRHGFDKKTMARDVRGVVEQLGLGPIALVGNDHGGGVAYAYAAQWPEHVTGLVVIEYWMAGFGYEQFLKATPNWNTGTNWQLVLFTLPDIAEWLLKGRERDLLAWFFWHAATHPHAISSEDFEIYVRDYTRPGALRAGINYYAAVWQDAEDNKGFAETPLAMPVLGIGGASSGGTQVGEALKPLARDVAAVSVENAGHWLLDENPEGVNRVLLDFLGHQGANHD